MTTHKVTGHSSLQPPSPLRELTCHMGSHSVTCHPTELTFPPLPQPKLVLDLANPDGCKAELIGTAVEVRSSCPVLHIAVAVVMNTTVRGEIRTWVFSHRSRTLCLALRSRDTDISRSLHQRKLPKCPPWRRQNEDGRSWRDGRRAGRQEGRLQQRSGRSAGRGDTAAAAAAMR